MAEEGRKLVEVLKLPFESMRTLSCQTGEVRKYRNELTGVISVGKRLSWAAVNDRTIVLREAQLLQQIRHSNIVPVFDVAVVEDPKVDRYLTVIEMIMPFYEKGSVYDSLTNNNRYSIGEAVRLARESLAGLSELHEVRRLLHRDIKSGNVFIDDDGHARVGDLGQAQPMDADGTAEAFVGNQLYTPPEVMKIGRCDRRVDIYGVGLMLFELLNGPFPYEAYTGNQVVARLEKGRRPVLDIHLEFKSFVPPRLRRIVNCAINKDPGQRYSSAREMADALNAAPMVDWRQTAEGQSHELVWEGTCAVTPETSYQVTASPKKGGRWLLRGRRRITQWRSFVEDQIVADPLGTDAQAFFDNIVKIATKR